MLPTKSETWFNEFLRTKARCLDIPYGMYLFGSLFQKGGLRFLNELIFVDGFSGFLDSCLRVLIYKNEFPGKCLVRCFLSRNLRP